MPDKLTSSEPASAAAAETPQAASAARKIYPIVKYGDPILEKPGAPVKKFDAELEQLAEDMFASMYAAQGVTRKGKFAKKRVASRFQAFGDTCCDRSL